MSISSATNHVSEILCDYYEKKDASDPVIPFLRKVSQIQEYSRKMELASWEADVLASADVNKIEERPDFPLIELAWEIGRINLFGEIKKEETIRTYQQAKAKLNDDLGLKLKRVESFDFSKW